MARAAAAHQLAGPPASPAADLLELALGGTADAAELLVLRGDSVVLHETTGAQPDATRFLLYSTSKMITAAAVLRLVDAGGLALDTRIASVLPEFTAGGKEDIRVEEVLSHTSGFPVEAGYEHAADWDYFVSWVCGLSLQHELRGSAHYHASTFGILGAVVERAAGVPFADYCRREVFEPLGMASTTWGLPADLEHLNAGYRGVGAELWAAGRLEDFLVPAGGAWSTAADIARLLQGFRGPGFLSEEMVRRARTPAARAPKGGWYFGLGLFIDGDGPVFARGTRAVPGRYGHSGHAANQAFHDPLRDLTVVCLTNALSTVGPSEDRYTALCDRLYERLG